MASTRTPDDQPRIMQDATTEEWQRALRAQAEHEVPQPATFASTARLTAQRCGLQHGEAQQAQAALRIRQATVEVICQAGRLLEKLVREQSIEYRAVILNTPGEQERFAGLAINHKGSQHLLQVAALARELRRQEVEHWQNAIDGTCSGLRPEEVAASFLARPEISSYIRRELRAFAPTRLLLA